MVTIFVDTSNSISNEEFEAFVKEANEIFQLVESGVVSDEELQYLNDRSQEISCYL